MCSVTAVCIICWSESAFAFNNMIGFGAGLYADSSERKNDIEPSIGGVQELDGSFDYEADSYLNLQLWYLRAAKEAGTFRILWGGGIAMYNDFSVGKVYCGLHASFFGGDYDLRPIGPHYGTSLYAHMFRHDQHQMIHGHG